MIFFISISCVNASENDTILSNEIDDVISISNENDNLTADAGTYAELEAAFLNNNKFTFEKDYAAHDGDGIINIKRSIEVDGKGHTIDAGELTGIFRADSSASDNINVVLKNIVFKNGNRPYGGAIMVEKAENVNMKIINCTFINNVATRFGGGSIYYYSTGTLEIINSTFKINVDSSDSVEFDGGAIDFGKGTLIVDGCEIIGSTVHNNYAAIHIDNSGNRAHEIRNSKFSENMADSAADSTTNVGSAIYIKSGSESGGLTIKNSEFSKNEVNTFILSVGGAITSVNGYLTIDNCDIIENVGKGNGGAINSQSKLTITNSRINLNMAHKGYGGAIYQNSDSGLKITDSVIKNNKAADNGGAIYIGNGNTEIINSTFYRNTNEKGDAVLSGGAIYNSGSGTLSLINSTFDSNAASPIGHDSFKELFSDFKGGAVYSEHDITIDGCTFENNYVKDRGGAVYTSAGITWGENPSKFIDNRVDIYKEHNTIASKGGAIYAGTFKNNPKGLIFIRNWAGYGGAVYINNKNEVTFESCYFEGNEASIPGGTGCGGAIYIDSSGSKLKLINNIFVDNKGKNDKGVYNCGEYSVTNNWYGINDVNFNDGYLVEWHKFKSDTKFTDSNSLRINLTSDKTEIRLDSPETLTLKFVCSDKSEFNGKLTNWNVTFTSDKKATFTSKQIGDNKATVVFAPEEGGNHTISATVNHQTVTLTLNVRTPGDFETLQRLVDNATNTLTLNRDYTYTIGIDTVTGGIVINKPLTINGNGHKINALGQSRIFNIGAPNVEINNIEFVNGSSKDGGALFISRGNITIENSRFFNNSARLGGAIHNMAINVTIKNSTFLNNKADSIELKYQDKDDELTFTLTVGENYINAIYSLYNISFSNVTYWDGAVTTGNNQTMLYEAAGQNIGLLIYDSKGSPARVVILKTDKNGLAKLDYSNLKEDNYTFNAYHQDNEYYTFIQTKGKFSVKNSNAYSSSVKINIPDKKEFVYGNCNISFDVVNKTEVGVAITNANHTEIYYSNLTDLNYVLVDLPASNDYYSIIVENLGNETYSPSSDTKLFKITKAKSTVSINPIDDVEYSNPLTVKFSGDGDSYNVTVYDNKNNAVFSQITDKQIISIPTLNVGTYTVNVTNLGNENKSSSKASEKFNVVKKDNKITVTVQDATYGEGTALTVYANADGKYTVYINSTEIPVDVTGGIGVKTLNPAAGSYKTNVTFDNPNYNNIIENYDFIIRKAQSNVRFSLENVTYKQNTTVTIFDNFPTEYNVTLYDSGNNLKFQDIINTTIFKIPGLDVGQYNLTVINMGNENITGSQWTDIFDVTTENYVYITAEDAIYDRDFFIYIEADVDGYYTVDINGTEITIEVIDGFGFNDELILPAGEYYANVTFDDDDYKNIIENTTFTIYPAESHLEIEDIENVTYGEDVNIEYYDDYNATFDVVIFDENEDAVWKFTTNATSVIISDLAAGNYTLMVTNRGDNNIIGVSEFKNFTVYKATPEMNVTADGNEIIVELPEDATGDVTTTINGKELSYPVVDGLAIIPLYELKPGNYSFDVKYSGDKNYTTDSGKVNVELTKITPEMNVTSNQKEINVVMSDDATGNVSTTVNGKEISVPLSKGKATIPLGDLNPGNYTFDVKYTGNDKYYPRSEKTSVNIPKINPNMTAYFEFNEVIIELPEDATGNVTTNINGVDYSSPVVEGLAIIPLYDLKPGNYTLDLKYSGDDKYLPDDEKITVELEKYTPEMTVTAKDNVISVELPEDANGNVTATVNGKKYSAQVNKGKATITITDLHPGKYTADVKYTGDDEYYPRSEKVDVTIPKINPEMKVHKNNDEIIVELPEDATGNVTIEVDGEKIVAPVENGKAEFSLDKLDSGDYNVSITYPGDDKYNPATKNDTISIDGIEMFADDVIKYFSGPEKLIVKLMNNDKAIPSKEIEITLNGVTYTRVTDEKGEVSLALNLDTGNYTALVESKDYGLSTLVDIEIKSTIISNDLIKVFRNATQFRALFLDGNGKAIANTNMEFNIHGIFYTRTTDANGWAELNINLEEGEYIITSINTVTGESKGNNVTVISLIESSDLTKYYKNGTQFVVRARSDDGGWAKEGEEVLFNINGIFYVRITNETGHASLNINLQPGNYIITSKFRDCEQGNNISVLPVLSTEDLNMKYKDGSQFRAKLVDGQGKAYPNQNIEFNVNGMLYTRTTDANGEAKLNINLMSGEYIITSSYNGANIANKITISS